MNDLVFEIIRAIVVIAVMALVRYAIPVLKQRQQRVIYLGFMTGLYMQLRLLSRQIQVLVWELLRKLL